jgi:hypothetical protein
MNHPANRPISAMGRARRAASPSRPQPVICDEIVVMLI